MEPLRIGLTQYGITEWIKGDNPEIVKYFHNTGHTWVREDETAWCTAFVNWCCFMSGKEYSRKLNARSWRKIGREVNSPTQGDIVVLWRDDPKSWKGHVGFFVRADKDQIYILGGNQDNKVCIKAYPKKKLLCYRRV